MMSSMIATVDDPIASPSVGSIKMEINQKSNHHRHQQCVLRLSSIFPLVIVAIVLLSSSAFTRVLAYTSPAIPSTGSCSAFAIHAASTITFAGPATTISSLNIGLSPGTSITGAPNYGSGSAQDNSASANACAVDKASACSAAASAACNQIIPAATIGGSFTTLAPGVYCSTVAMTSVTAGTNIIFDGQNDCKAAWIIQTSAALTFGAGTTYTLLNGAKVNNIFWSVGTSATVGANCAVPGTFLSDQSISFGTGTTIAGFMYARGAAITFDGGSTVSPPSASPSQCVACVAIPLTSGVTATCTPQLTPSAVGAVCTFSCASITSVLQGSVSQTCMMTTTTSSSGTTYAAYWTGITMPPRCADTKPLAIAGGICELQSTQAASLESCNACSTLLWEAFDIDVIGASRWSVVDFSGQTNGPSSWSVAVTSAGLTVATQTKSTLSCSTIGCISSALVFQGGAKWTNYKARMRFAFTSLTGTIGLAVYWQSATSYIEYVVYFSGDRMLRRNLNGVITNLWLTTMYIPFVAGAYINVEVEVRFGRIRVWNDGVLVGQPAYYASSDVTATVGTVAVTIGSQSTPLIDFVNVQQMSEYHLPSLNFRLFVNAQDTFIVYMNGAAQTYSNIGTVMRGGMSVVEYWLPWSASAAIAVIATQLNYPGEAPAIMVRSPWNGIDTGANWWCAPGSLTSSTVTGVTLSSAFKPAVVQNASTTLSGFSYSSRDFKPAGIWTAMNAATYTYDTTVTCVLPRMSPLLNEPTVVPTAIPTLSLLPLAPYPFDYNAWSKVDVPGYTGVAGVWNMAGPAPTPTGSLTLPNGYTLDTGSGGLTLTTNYDMTVQGQFHIYRFGYNFTDYTFSTYIAVCDLSTVGIVFAYTDLSNYYEYVVSYVDGYHSVRKHIVGVVTTLFIASFNSAPGSYIPVSVVMGGGAVAVTASGSMIYSGAISPSLPSGTVGLHVAYSACGYFHSTSINFFSSIAGATGNVGLWTNSGLVRLSPLGLVTESSTSGVTFYTFTQSNWAAAWSNPGLPGSTLVAGWQASVQVSMSSYPTMTGGSIGLAFYYQSPSSYYEVIFSTSMTNVSMKLHATGVNTTVLCSSAVAASSSATSWRTLLVQSLSSNLNLYVDGVLICSIVDPNALIPLASQGRIALMSNQISTGVSSLYQSLLLQWVPTLAQDSGACGLLFCPCNNGGVCVNGAIWNTNSCTCPSLWNVASTCLVPQMNLLTSTVTGTGLTGDVVGTVLNIAIAGIRIIGTKPLLNVDSTYLSNMNITVLCANVFGVLTATITPTVTWLGNAGNSYIANFAASYTVPFAGTITVLVAIGGSPLGANTALSTGKWSYQVPVGSYVDSFILSGNGVVSITMGATAYVNLIALDDSGIEFTGSASFAPTLAMTVTLPNGGTTSYGFVWTGVGGRYRSSYVITTLVSSVTIILYQSSIRITSLANSYTAVVQSQSAIVIVPYAAPSRTLYFKWTTSSAITAMIAAGQPYTILQYNLLLSDEPLFASLTAARYTIAPPTSALAIMLPVATKVYVKVSVKVIDPFTNAAYFMDMANTEYSYTIV